MGWVRRVLAIQAVLALVGTTWHGRTRADEPVKAALPEHYVLDNGLRVILQRDPLLPLVAVAVSYEAGTRDEPAGYRELAHVTEHMSFRGSRHLEDGEATRRLDAVGARWNGFTEADRTVYVTELPSRHLPLALWIESERMGFTLEALDADKLDVELEVVRSEWLERGAEQLGSRLGEYQYHALFPPGHPYRGLADRGEERDFDFSLDHVRWFHQAYYRPDNAVLAIVGDFDPVATRALVAQYFAPLAAPATRQARPALPEVRPRSTRVLDLAWRYPRSMIVMRWLVSCGQDASCPRLLRLAADWATEGPTPLLPPLFERGTEVAMQVVPRANHHEVVLSVTLPPDADLVQAQTAVDRALAELKDGQLAPADFDAMKQLLHLEELEQSEQPMVRAQRLASTPPAASSAAPPQRSLTARDVEEAVRNLLPWDGRLVTRIRFDKRSKLQGEVRDSNGSLGIQGEELP